MDSGEAKRLKQLEDENRKLKQVVADLTLASSERAPFVYNGCHC